MTTEITPRTLIKLVVGACALFFLFIGGCTMTGHNDTSTWQVVQYPTGGVEIRDTPGYYLTWGAKVWTYPRNLQVEYHDKWAFPVVFNDSGVGTMDTLVRFSAPLTAAGKLELHNQFAGNMENIEAAVWAHMSNAMKASGPIMSASEHQSARRSEFDQLVHEQLNAGLYETKKSAKELHDQTDEKGKPITVYYTEIILDEKGKPKVANESPIAKLGLTVTQFSVTHVSYDPTTQAQFEQKKQAFLAAESSKAQREKEVQERLMVEEKGRRQKAEIEASSNQQLAAATIAANQQKLVAETNALQEKNVAETNAAKLVAVALQTKQEAETKAAQEKSVAEIAASRMVAVALLTKQEAETKALQELEVAKLQRSAADQNAAKQVALATAQKESLALGGAISERDRVLAEISRDQAIGVARELSKIAVPSTVFNGGSSNGSSSPTSMDNLISVTLMEKLNALPKSTK